MKEANDHFDKLVHQIFKSNDLKLSLQNLYKSLHLFFPLDMINLPIGHLDKGTLHYLAVVMDGKVLFIDETVKRPENETQQEEKSWEEKLFWWNNSYESELLMAIGSQINLKEATSTIGIISEIEPGKNFALGLVAWGLNRYNHSHYDLLKKLYEPLSLALNHILQQLEFSHLKKQLLTENMKLRKKIELIKSNQVVGSKTGLRKVMTQVGQVALQNCPVLITGETGVGKDVIANMIHQQSARSEGPMISFNCGAMPETLVDSELFGHEKGAFTGAAQKKNGYFEQADCGTLFLDEIGELPLQAQVKLLRILQNKQFRRVGGSKDIYTDIRVIAATNRDMPRMIKQKKFRKDLWYRLNVFPIYIPPLKDRKEDIPRLAYYFATQKAIEMGLPFKPRFRPGAIEQLQFHDWPGNVRELQNVIEKSLIINGDEPLTFTNLLDNGDTPLQVSPIKQPGRFLSMDEMIAQHIQKSLELSKGQVGGNGGAAELLKMNPSTLRARMRKLSISAKG